MNANDKGSKKEKIVSRAVEILTTYLTETNRIQKIKEIVCNNATINRAKKSNKIFHIIFSPESIDALIQNMKLTATAKSGIEIFKASKKVSSFFSRKITKTTTQRKTMTMTTNRSRSSDPVVSQVDVFLKPDSIPIIESALEHLMQSCSSVNFVNVVQSQCIKPIIKRVVANGTDVESYFSGGGRFPKVVRRRSSSRRTRRHSQRNSR
jgi:hypothetical protein